MVNFLNLPTVQAPRNALADFSGINNAIDSNRRNALMERDDRRQDEQMAMRRENQTYQRGRDQKQDQWQTVQRAGAMADAIQRMPDTDPAKARAWQNYIRAYGDGDHSPEELDFRTGPAIAAAAIGKWRDPREDRMKDLELQKTQAEIGKLNRSGGDSEAPSNVREWRYFNSLNPDDQQRYLTMKRAEKYLDVGTGFVQPNPVAPGANVRTIAKDLVGAERDKGAWYGYWQGRRRRAERSAGCERRA